MAAQPVLAKPVVAFGAVARRLDTACALLGVFLIVASLNGAEDLTHIDEHRYAEVSRVMAAPGGDWLVPHLNGEIYHDKPPLFFWAAASLQRIGVALPAAAVLPSLLGTALALLGTFGIARRRLGMRAAVASVVVLAATVRFASFAGRANLDALLTGFVVFAIYASVRGDDAGRGRGRGPWYAIGCLSAGAGVLVKGPIGIAVPLVAVAGGRILEGRGRSLVSVWALAALGLALLPIGTWLVAAGFHAGWAYPEQIMVRHAFEHALGRVNHAGQPWDYLRIFPEAFLPGTLLLPAALLGVRWQRPFAAGDALPLAWLIGGFVLLSLLPVKRHHYLMPLYPGAALVVAGLFRSHAPPRAVGFGAALVGAVGRLAVATWGGVVGVAAVGVVLAVGVGVDPIAATHASGVATPRAEAWWRLAAGTSPALLGTAGLLGIFLVGMAVVTCRARSERWRALAMAAIALGVTLGDARLVEPVVETARGRRAFFESIAVEIGDGAVADYGRMHFAVNWALARDVVPVLGDSVSAARFLASHPPGGAFLLADRESLERQGMPDGARVLHVWKRALDSDLVLVGAAAQ